jgi:hypothetical protein
MSQKSNFLYVYNKIQSNSIASFRYQFFFTKIQMFFLLVENFYIYLVLIIYSSKQPDIFISFQMFFFNLITSLSFDIDSFFSNQCFFCWIYSRNISAQNKMFCFDIETSETKHKHFLWTF